MTLSLYELTESYRAVQALMFEAKDEDYFKALDMIEEGIESKADNIARIIRNNAADIEALKSEEKRLADRRKVLEAKIDRLKEYLQENMELTGKVKFKTQLFSFNIQNNPPSCIIDDENSLPKDYISYEPKVDKKAILEQLKAGEEVPGAHMIQGRGLRIR